MSTFTKVAGQATLSASGSLTRLRIDTDGDGRYDLQFALTGNHVGQGSNLYTGRADANGRWIL